MMLNLSRIIRTSYLHIRRNAKLSAASILIMALTFFVSSLFIVSLYGAGIILNYFENQSQIIVFFNPDTYADDYMNTIKNAVLAEHVPTQIHYVSKHEAYVKYLTFLKQDSPSLSQSVNEDKLPPSLEIKTTNIDDLQKIANVLYSYQNQSKNIDKILYYKNVEDFLKEFIKVVRISALAFISFLAGISLLIIWITIGIALTSHSDEIEIMELVGATRSFIELPYIVEGAIYGIIGAFVSILMVGILYFVLTRFYSSTYIVLLSYFKGIPVPAIGVEQILLVILGEMVLGGLVGSIGSFIAIRSKLS